MSRAIERKFKIRKKNFGKWEFRILND